MLQDSSDRPLDVHDLYKACERWKYLFSKLPADANSTREELTAVLSRNIEMLQEVSE